LYNVSEKFQKGFFMRKIALTFCAISLSLIACATPPVENPRLSQYLSLTQEFSTTLGPAGSWQQQEIEIALSPEKIEEIEQQTRQRLISKGFSESQAKDWTQVGIVAEDNYWIWLRDAVTFPTGAVGTYGRLIWKNALDGPPGVAVMPVLPNKKIIVNVNYRHATRSWEIELPRGGRNKGETLEATAKREVEEETGYSIDSGIHLGDLASDTGVLAGVVPVYFGLVVHAGESRQEFSEAISGNPSFSKEELKQALSQGYMEVDVKGKKVRAACRDAFLAYALLQAETKGLL
jgi:ADP-ribose pyrophosphatase